MFTGKSKSWGEINYYRRSQTRIPGFPHIYTNLHTCLHWDTKCSGRIGHIYIGKRSCRNAQAGHPQLADTSPAFLQDEVFDMFSHTAPHALFTCYQSLEADIDRILKQQKYAVCMHVQMCLGVRGVGRIY